MSKLNLNIDMESLFNSLSVKQTEQLLALAQDMGIYSKHFVVEDVNKWYAEASEGTREHMANKLAKYGYPTKGKHSKPEETFSRGDRLKRKGSKYIYMLANAGPDTVQIVNLTTGQRWDSPVRVENVFKITRPELAKITQNSNVRFEKEA